MAIKPIVNPTMLMDYAGNVPVDADNPLPVEIVNVTTPVELTGDVVLDTFGALDNAKEVDPDAASATIPALLRGILQGVGAGEYETVAKSQTAQALGATGATGDVIRRVVIIPETVSPGVVTLLDNAISIELWLGGTVGADLKPFVVDLGMVSVSGAWKITTGDNVHVIAIGDFT